MNKLKNIEEETADCRKAFDGVEIGAIVKNCHHDRLLEPLSEPAEMRIAYILTNKPKEEQARRLREFRPWPYPLTAEWSKAYAESSKVYAEWSKAYAEWGKAYAEWSKADDLSKAYAEWSNADAEWRKVDAEFLKADAEFLKADAEPAIIAQLHSSFPDTTWNGKSIFGDGRTP